MSKNIIAIFTGLAISILLFLSFVYVQSREKRIEYKNEQYSFSFLYPESWKSKMRTNVVAGEYYAILVEFQIRGFYYTKKTAATTSDPSFRVSVIEQNIHKVLDKKTEYRTYKKLQTDEGEISFISNKESGIDSTFAEALVKLDEKNTLLFSAENDAISKLKSIVKSIKY